MVTVLTQLATEDVAVFQPPEQQIVQGKQAVRTWMDAFPTIKAFEDEAEDIEGRGDFAAARGTFAMTVELSPANRIAMTGK